MGQPRTSGQFGIAGTQGVEPYQALQPLERQPHLPAHPVELDRLLGGRLIRRRRGHRHDKPRRSQLAFVGLCAAAVGPALLAGVPRCGLLRRLRAKTGRAAITAGPRRSAPPVPPPAGWCRTARPSDRNADSTHRAVAESSSRSGRRFAARVQSSVAAITAAHRDGRAVHQGKRQAPVGMSLATAVGQQMIQHVAAAEQGYVGAGAGVQIHQRGDVADDARSVLQTGRFWLHLPPESCRFASCQV